VVQEKLVRQARVAARAAALAAAAPAHAPSRRAQATAATATHLLSRTLQKSLAGSLISFQLLPLKLGASLRMLRHTWRRGGGGVVIDTHIHTHVQVKCDKRHTTAATQ
jgi:hypothetical protein